MKVKTKTERAVAITADVVRRKGHKQFTLPEDVDVPTGAVRADITILIRPNVKPRAATLVLFRLLGDLMQAAGASRLMELPEFRERFADKLATRKGKRAKAD